MSENSVPTVKSIESLPNDYLLYLFINFLDFNTKIFTERVCKRWQQLIKISFDCKRSLIISDYELHDNRINGLNFSQQKISVVKMVSFHLMERTESKDRQFISMILRKYRNLETLCVCLKFTKCNNKYLDLVSKYCCKSVKNLRLELSECSVNNRTLIISEEEVQKMSEKLPNLKYFYIDFVILFINEQSLQTIFTKWSNIETIIFHTPCFRGCVYNSELENMLSTEFSGDHFACVGPGITKMEMPANVLNANAITRMSGKTRLKRLIISKLNINLIESIAKCFPNLSYFGFTVESNVNEEDMYHLMERIGKLTHLEELYVGIISGFAINHNCIKFLRSCNHLNALRIDQTLMNKEAVDAITRYFPNIETLELFTSGLNQNFHHCLNDIIITNIKKLKFLRKLNFRGQRNISDNAIATIISNCPLLDSIDVRTTKAAIITLKVLIEKSNRLNKTIEVFINETPICRLFSQEFKRFEICKHLVLSNEEFDYKFKF